MEKDSYLGDGLYVTWDGFYIELYAWNGMEKTNQVFMEPMVLMAFEVWVRELREAIKEAGLG
jgi:hypothetical protein